MERAVRQAGKGLPDVAWPCESEKRPGRSHRWMSQVLTLAKFVWVLVQ